MTASGSHLRRSPHASDRREQAALGILLIAIGAVVALGNLFPDMAHYVVLGVGLVPLVAFFVARWHWAMIWGGIQTGAGVGVLLVTQSGADEQGGLFLLGLAAGFLAVGALAIAFNIREHRLWPLIPGGILAAIGTAQIGGATDVVQTLFQFGWPLALFVAGAVFLGRAVLTSRRATSGSDGKDSDETPS